MMNTIVVDSEGRDCRSCGATLGSQALKCNKCTNLYHLRCTDFPEYHLVRFMQTRPSFVCRGCVPLEKPLTHQATVEKVKALLLEEEALVADVGAENDVFSDTTMNISRGPNEESNGEASGTRDNATPPEDPVSQEATATTSTSSDIDRQPVSQEVTATANTNSDTNRPPDPTQQDQNESENRRRTRICKFYKTSSCKHGVNGNGCKFSHPKKCIKFLKHGEKAGGCKKKGECQRYHPPLCWNSVNYGTCHHKKCTFHHLRGTKFTSREEPQTDVPADDERREVRRDSRRDMSRPRQDKQRPTYAQMTVNPRPRPPPAVAKEDENQQDFADLRWEMGQLREMVKKLLDRDRAGPPPPPPPPSVSYSGRWGERSWH